MAKVAQWFKHKHKRLKRVAVENYFSRKYKEGSSKPHQENVEAQIKEFLKRGGKIRRFDSEGKPI